MHINHRRKNFYKSYHPRWGVSLHEWRRRYWKAERSRVHIAMAQAQFDDLLARHPQSILWDVF